MECGFASLLVGTPPPVGDCWHSWVLECSRPVVDLLLALAASSKQPVGPSSKPVGPSLTVVGLRNAAVPLPLSPPTHYPQPVQTHTTFFQRMQRTVQPVQTCSEAGEPVAAVGRWRAGRSCSRWSGAGWSCAQLSLGPTARG